MTSTTTPHNLDESMLLRLQKTLGHTFNNTDLLAAALTHSSAHGECNYERLEFLGDRVLGLIMADILFKAFPEESEGDLAKRHAALVQGKTLATKAEELELGLYMKFSASERAAGGDQNKNILADGFEALLGALYLDGGLAKTAEFIKTLWGQTIYTVKEPPQDPKTALQEWAQARGLPLPVYTIADRVGPDHAPRFTIEVAVGDLKPASAQGPSRRVAEKKAAATLFERLTQDTAT